MSELKHIAFIMDGNGRWAKAQGKSRQEGHKSGFDNLIKILKECKEIGLTSATCYAFSTENWKRPQAEVEFLMKVPIDLYNARKQELLNSEIKVQFVGRRDRIPPATLKAIEDIEQETSIFEPFTAYIAYDYGTKDELVRVFEEARTSNKEITEEVIEALLPVPAIDLLIRTSGEQRLSNFLLWQLAYAELLFVEDYWPDFTPSRLHEAIEEYNERSRRYGGL
jgi:undecaprenyl diphosphate synthase